MAAANVNLPPEGREALLSWFDSHRRSLPWRETRDPYAIWVSEVMLQQTQVATVIPYWRRWMSRFPSVEALAFADEQEVLSIWQGLGYYHRCRMLLEGARWVVENGVPGSAREWLSVPGVGRYTAGAIASIAFGEACPVVDGNVERVFARLSECRDSGPVLTRQAWSWAEALVDRARPGDWNQTLMELGATVCRPKSPLCGSCPVSRHCLAFRSGSQDQVPVKPPARSVVEIAQHVLVPISARGRFGLRQIPLGQWWTGMWEFPREDSRELLPWLGTSVGTVRHRVTHHRIRLSVSYCEDAVEIGDLVWHRPQDLAALPMPSPQRKVLALVPSRLRGPLLIN